MTEIDSSSPHASFSTDERRELLKLLLQKKGIHLEQATTIPRRCESTPVELSFAQQRLWFIQQLEEVSTVYNLSAALHLAGMLHVVVLEQALAEIVRRHEVLRTTFPRMNGSPVQVIAGGTVTISVMDLRSLPEQEQSLQVQRLAFQESQRPFDLALGPLLRVSLLQLGEQSHVLLVTMHHIISDGWSTGIFIRELAALYEAFLTGLPSPLPELPIQYADFANWQRQWLSGEVLAAQLDYWRQQLADAPPLLELPTDRARPPVQTFQGGREEFQISQRLTQKLISLSQKSGATLFMTLLAAFMSLLARYTSQSDIVVGTPIANRNRQEIESLIGFFVNTLVLRADLQGNPTFLELLSRVQQVALDAYAHQDLPFEQVVEALQPERSLSHSPLFQVMFVLQNAPNGKLELPGLVLTPLKSDSVTARFDLTLAMEETQEGLKGELEYNSDLFDASTIARMARHFQTMLMGIVANPEQRLSELPLLSAAERHQLLVEWNDTQADYPGDKCLHQLVEAQVERTPDAVAVVFEDQKLSYRELNARANKIAHYLKSLNVGPEVLVGLCAERSVEMMVGLLGILKAGGAYVPLDPAYPQERLAFMLEDAQVSVLLTQEKLIPKFPKSAVRLVCLDTGWQVISQEKANNPVSGVQPENLAYVIYTSGSTGKPKGTAIAHRGVVNYLSWCTKAYAVAEGCGSPVHSSMGFDATITSLFSPLLVGQKVLLLPEKEEIAALAATLSSQSHFSLVKITPAHLDILSQLLASKKAVGQTRALIIGGEALSGKSLSFWRTYMPGTRLINEYGPTETVVGCCVYEVTEQTSLSGAVPIGRPIANTQLYILDKSLQPVPIGVPGELYIGGVGLARGYLNATELTEEKFIPNPFSEEPEARLYKTGDQARYLEDGNIQFLGRLDHQVKLRGFRIELGEIEAALSQHPFVRQTVVIVREDQPGNKQLVAYVVAYEESLSTSELRSFLREKLPEYMVPNVFVLQSALPMTPNGKIDLHALPAPDSHSRSSESSFVPPRTPTEKILADIWTQVLGLEVVGIHDNFFELGGDSIKAIQVISRLAQHNLKLKERHIFQYPTIAELAQQVAQSYAQADQGFVSGNVALTPIQSWFFSTYPGDKHHFNQSLILATPARWDVDALHRVCQQLVLHHDALRLRFKLVNGEVVQEYGGADHPLCWEIVDLMGRVDAQSQLEAFANRVQARMHLEHGPLIQFIVFHLERGDRLLMAAHHLIIDTVSWRILLEDLSQGYEQACAGEEIQFPAKTDSYQRWSTALQKYSTTPALVQQLEYWQHLGNMAVDGLTIDAPDAENLVGDSCNLGFSLTPEETNSLLTEVHRPYNTEINDILLTALALALHAWCGGSRFLIDLEGHGRVDDIDGIDVSRTVGWFTSIYPVLLDLAPPAGVDYQIKSTKEMLRRVPHKGIGYGIGRYLLSSEPESTSLTQLQPAIIFNYLGRIDEDIRSSVFELAPESCGDLISSQSRRTHELEFSGIVYDQRLSFSVTFSATRFQQQSIQKLLDHYQQALTTIVEHCQQLKTTEITPSDLTYGNFSLEEFEEIFADD